MLSLCCVQYSLSLGAQVHVQWASRNPEANEGISKQQKEVWGTVCPMYHEYYYTLTDQYYYTLTDQSYYILTDQSYYTLTGQSYVWNTQHTLSEADKMQFSYLEADKSEKMKVSYLSIQHCGVGCTPLPLCPLMIKHHF